MSGWIKLHRKIFENPFYFAEKFTRSQAWIDLLLLANFEEGFFYKRGIKVIVSRGQIGYDLDSLGIRWKWSRGKVERFINELENENQIVRLKTNVTTLISIINYEIYQMDSKPNSKANSKANENQIVRQTVNQTVRQTVRQTVNQTETNNNNKEEIRRIKEEEEEKKEEEKKDFVSQKSETLHQKLIQIHNDFYLKTVTVPYKFAGGADGAAVKEIINYLKKVVREKKKTANDSETTDVDIENSFRYIFANYEMWNNFYKSQLKLSQINSNLPNIIANIKNPITKKETALDVNKRMKTKLIKEIQEKNYNANNNVTSVNILPKHE